MNPFPTRQDAEAYLSRITDAGLRDATRARLGLEDLASPAAVHVAAPPSRPLARQLGAPEPSLGTLTFTLPFPPSLNRIWRAVVITKKGKPQARILLSEDGRTYRRRVQEIIRALGWPRCPPAARLALHLHVCPPDRRARDLSNLPKALEDALTHAGVWADDRLIDDLRVTRGRVTRRGHVLVTITPLEHP